MELQHRADGGIGLGHDDIDVMNPVGKRGNRMNGGERCASK